MQRDAQQRQELACSALSPAGQASSAVHHIIKNAAAISTEQGCAPPLLLLLLLLPLPLLPLLLLLLLLLLDPWLLPLLPPLLSPLQAA